MVTDQQVWRLFDVRHKHSYQYQAADVARMSSKTAGKLELNVPSYRAEQARKRKDQDL